MPADIAVLSPGLTETSSGRTIARDPANGFLYAVGQNVSGTQINLTGYRSGDQGATWQLIGGVIGNTYTSLVSDLKPSIAVDSYGSPYVAWVSWTGGQNIIMVFQWNGSVWSDVSPIASGTWPYGTDPYLFRCNTPGHMHLLFAARAGNYPENYNSIKHCKKEWNGAFTVPTYMNQLQTTEFCYQPCAAVDSIGVVHIAFTRIPGSKFNVMYARSLDDGVSYDFSYAYMNDPTCHAQHPALAVNPVNDYVLLAVQQETVSGQPYNIYTRVCTDRGGTWTANLHVDNDPGYSNVAPTVAFDTGNRGIVMWHGNFAGSPHDCVRYGVSADSGQTWTGFTNISDPALSVSAPSLCVFTAFGRLNYDYQIGGTIRSDFFTVNSPPNKPILTSTTAPTGGQTATNACGINWVFSDPDAGNVQYNAHCQIVRMSDGALIFDTDAGVGYAGGSWGFPANYFVNGNTYAFRVRVQDNATPGAWSAYSDYYYITFYAPPTLAIISPATDTTVVGTPSLTVQWSYASAGGRSQNGYQVNLWNAGGTILYDSGSLVGASIRSFTIPYTLVTGASYSVRIGVTDDLGSYSGTVTRLFTTSFVALPAATLALSLNDGYISLTQSHGVQKNANPKYSYYEIFRRNLQDPRENTFNRINTASFAPVIATLARTGAVLSPDASVVALDGQPLWMIGKFSDTALHIGRGVTNLCTNPSFETVLTGWTAPVGGSYARVSSPGPPTVNLGSWILAVQAPTGTYPQTSFSGTIGLQYVASVWVLAGVGTTVVAQFVNPAYNATFGDLSIAGNSIWQHVYIYCTANATGTWSFRVLNATASTTFYIDGVLIEQGPNPETVPEPSGYNDTTHSMDIVTVPTAGKLTALGPWSVSYWFKFDWSGNSIKYMFNLGTKLRVYMSSTLQGWHPVIGFSDISGTDHIQDCPTYQFNATVTQWHHFVFAWTGQTITVYMDSVLVWTLAASFPQPTPANIIFGSDASGNTFVLNGLIDEIRLHNVALTQAQVTTLYNGGNDYRTIDATVTAYFDFEQWLQGQVPIVAYRDYSVASDASYDYYLRVWSTQGISSDSPIVSGGISFLGLWLHSVLDPQGTAYHFMDDFGERGEMLKPVVTMTRILGREFSVAEFDATMSDGDVHAVLYFQYSKVRFGGSPDRDAYRAIVEKRGTVCYRDYRGRRIWGVILDGYNVTDAPFKYNTTITLTRNDYKDIV